MVGQYVIVHALLKYLRTPRDFESMRSMANVLLAERNYQPIAVRTLFAWIKELREEGLIDSQIHGSGKTVYMSLPVGKSTRRVNGCEAIQSVLRQSRSPQAIVAQQLWDEVQHEIWYLPTDPEMEFGEVDQNQRETSVVGVS
jgi:hypothetical protein